MYAIVVLSVKKKKSNYVAAVLIYSREFVMLISDNEAEGATGFTRRVQKETRKRKRLVHNLRSDSLCA